MLARINRSFVPAYWDDFLNDKFFNGFSPAAKNNSAPAVNVTEEDKLFRIEVAAPGVTAEDIRIDLENDLLTISTEHTENKEETDRRYLRKEFNYSSFKRSFQLPDTVNTESIRAGHESGILTIELPKKEEVVQKAPRQIAVEGKKKKV
jgi:HSP20 family protein